ncbi:hypothetical protein SH2C18_45560 [Clostridium sediminicola]|uniref:hypothetical protein n=1 Tax=Clostridium sediminicola TaxID=3114879 RepID=UPI0031F1CAE0
MNKVFTVDGTKFSDFYGFCEEFSEKVLSGKYIWRGNLDTVNDIIFGGFGDIGDGEEYTIIWKDSYKSRKDLGYAETICQLKKRLITCHPSSVAAISDDIKKAENNEGTTVFEWLIEIIRDNYNVTLFLE